MVFSNEIPVDVENFALKIASGEGVGDGEGEATKTHLEKKFISLNHSDQNIFVLANKI